MRKCSVLGLAVVASLVFVAALAQDTATSDMDVILDKIKADKKLLVAVNMDLSEDEEAAFWPVYDAYQRQLEELNARTANVVADYADGYNSELLDDAMAAELVNEMLDIEAAEVVARKALVSELQGSIPGIQLARYLQIESKIRAAIRYEIAAGVPLIP